MLNRVSLFAIRGSRRLRAARSGATGYGWWPWLLGSWRWFRGLAGGV